MGNQEQIPAKKKPANSNSFDLPEDIGVPDSGLLSKIQENLSYITYGFLIVLIILGATYLNTDSDLAGQLNTPEAVSTVVDDDALDRFATDELDLEDPADVAGPDDALPPPPSLSRRGSAEDPASTNQDENMITITASDFEFDKKAIEVQAGSLVKIKFTVESGTHSFVIDDLVESKTLKAGESEVLEFTTLSNSDLIYYCGLHPMMTGKVKVLGGVKEPEVDTANSTSELDADIEALLSGADESGTDNQSQINEALDQTQDFSQPANNNNSNSSLASNTQSQVLETQSVMGNSGPESWFLLLLFGLILYIVKPKLDVQN